MKIPFFKRQRLDKNFRETLEKYQRAAEENPNDLRIRIKIAELYLEHGQKEKAIEDYLEAARIYEEKRIFQIAVAIYKHVISIDPDQVDVYVALAELHLKNGFVGDSVAVLEKLANHYYEKDMKYESAQILRKISEIDPQNKFFKIKVAKFFENRDISEEEVIKIGPKDKWQLEEKRKDKEETNEEDSVKNFFDLEAALKDDVSVNFLTISNEEETEIPDLFEGSTAPDDVFKELKTMLESEPEKDNPQFHYNLGLAYQRCNQPEEALGEFQTALNGLEKKVKCYMKLADCSIILQRFDEAEDFIGKGLKIDTLTDEERLDLNYQLGLIYKAKGDIPKALKVFRRIYELDKNFKAVSMEINKLSSQ